MILSVTGHRPDKLGGYGAGVANKLDRVSEYWLRHLGPDRVITGMAAGWDQSVARSCMRLGLPFVAAVPCDNQDARWPYRARVSYQLLLDKASQVYNVSPGPYETWKLFKRNEWMVDNSDEVLALWNGDRHGGTWDTVHYAQHKKKLLHNAWPQFTGGT